MTSSTQNWTICKSAGLDGINLCILKNTAEIICGLLFSTIIYNAYRNETFIMDGRMLFNPLCNCFA